MLREEKAAGSRFNFVRACRCHLKHTACHDKNFRKCARLVGWLSRSRRVHLGLLMCPLGLNWRVFICGSPTADEDAEREKKGRDEQHSQQEHSRPAFVALKLFKRRMARARSLCVGLVAHERRMKTVSNSRLTCRRNF